jgi:predicted transcriptional regulator
LKHLNKKNFLSHIKKTQFSSYEKTHTHTQVSNPTLKKKIHFIIYIINFDINQQLTRKKNDWFKQENKNQIGIFFIFRGLVINPV